MRVLHCNPASEEDQIWLPYAWGRFREYCDHRSEYDLSSIQWLDPIYMGWFDVDKLLIDTDFASVDVLLLSFYVWNEERQWQIAKIARKQNPDILILGGGPQCQYRPHQNTKEYEVCDYVTPWEGEDVIAEILHRRLANRSIDDMDLLVDPRYPRDKVNAKRLQLKEAQSPFILYKDDFIRFSNQIRNFTNNFATMWETNRGCPYKCSFCDWGSATSDKIRRYGYETVLEEIELFGELKLAYVFNADANFGIFKEDLDYVQRVVDTNKKTGYPKELQFSAAKNKKEISNKAHKLLFDAGMNSGAQISFQHTDGQVLEAIDRSNIKQEKLSEELEEAFKNNIPLVGVSILGNPEDTVEKWKFNLGHMLEIGFHDDLRVHDFMLLPNAPAAEPEYVKRYAMKTIRRRNYNSIFKTLYYSDFIVETNSYTRDDYAEMQTFTYFLTAFHITNVSKFIAMYLFHYQGIHYSKFYDMLKDMPTCKNIYNEVREHMNEYVSGLRDSKEITFHGNTCNIDVYIKGRAVEEIEGILHDLEKLLILLTPLSYDQIEDMVKTQSMTIVSWNKVTEKDLNYNFTEIFDMLNKLTPNQKSNYIDIAKRKREVQLKDTTVGSQWKYKTDDMKDISSWISHISQKQPNKRAGLFHYQDILEC
jgi:putative methyltransferase